MTRSTRLNRKLQENQDAAIVVDRRSGWPGAAPTGAILIVDDEELVCRTYCNAFREAGYKVFAAGSGKRVLPILGEEAIQAIFLDVFMPDQDGLETLMTIKRASPETLVVVMSGGTAKFDYLDAALKLGADEIVRKPASPTSLLEVLARLTAAKMPEAEEDRRKFERIRMDLPGHLFNPVDWQSMECRVLNLSAGGALAECSVWDEDQNALVLYIEHFGRFEGRIVHRSQNLIGLEFSVGEAKRCRLKEMLAAFAENGVSGVAGLRKSPRFRSGGSVKLMRESGHDIACDVLDISLEGASLSAAERPPLGELVRVGKTQGRVVRHHDYGFALQFLRDRSDAT